MAHLTLTHFSHLTAETNNNARRLTVCFRRDPWFMLIEVIGGGFLLSVSGIACDAGHMLTSYCRPALSLLAVQFSRPPLATSVG